MKLVDHFQYGLNSPICLTWELTYACNLACVHCLSSSGRRDPRELTTAEAKGVVDELQKMQVFYVNIGGGEPTHHPHDLAREPGRVWSTPIAAAGSGRADHQGPQG